MTSTVINLHIFFAPFRNESRALREAYTIAAMERFDEVIFAAYCEGSDATEERIAKAISVWRPELMSWPFLPGRVVRMLQFIEWTGRVVWRFRRSRIPIIQPHSLAALPAGVLTKLMTGAKIVYDAHELETERLGWSSVLRWGARILEGTLIHFVDHTLVVSDSIKAWYQEAYRVKNISTVRNLPSRRLSNIDRNSCLRDAFDIPNDQLIFIYQGLIARGRGIDVLLDVFKKLEPSKHLVLMGYGPQVALVKGYEERYPNIHYLEAVPAHEVLTYTAGADVGLCLIEDACLSYRYCLPNKLFEYMGVGLAVVGSDLPEIRKALKGYDQGWVVPSEPAAIRDVLDSIGARCWDTSATVGGEPSNVAYWEDEQEILTSLLHTLLEAQG